MNLDRKRRLILTRRRFFGRTAAGIGTAALTSLLDPLLFAAPSLAATHFAPKAKRVIYDGVGELNEMSAKASGDPEINARIAQYEMAFRMQTSVPELTDFSKEPKHVLEMYGIDDDTLVIWGGELGRTVYRFQGRDYRPTDVHGEPDVHGEVVNGLLA